MIVIHIADEPKEVQPMARIDRDDTGSFVPSPGERFRVRIHTRVEVTEGEETKSYMAIHDVQRCTNDRWRVRIERPGREPHEMSGAGDVPAIIEADGALVILVPRRDSPSAST